MVTHPRIECHVLLPFLDLDKVCSKRQDGPLMRIVTDLVFTNHFHQSEIGDNIVNNVKIYILTAPLINPFTNRRLVKGLIKLKQLSEESVEVLFNLLIGNPGMRAKWRSLQAGSRANWVLKAA